MPKSELPKKRQALQIFLYSLVSAIVAPIVAKLISYLIMWAGMNENEEDLWVILAWLIVGLIISAIISFFIKRAAKKRVGFNMESIVVMLCVFGLTLILTEIFYWLGIISYLMQFFAIIIAMFNLQITAQKRPFSFIREQSATTQAKEAERKTAAQQASEQASEPATEESSELSSEEKKE